MVEKQVEFAAVVSLFEETTQVFSRALAKISSVREELPESTELLRTVCLVLDCFLGQKGCIASEAKGGAANILFLSSFSRNCCF